MGDVGVRRPTLDDVFLALTGQAATTSARLDDPPGPTDGIAAMAREVA